MRRFDRLLRRSGGRDVFRYGGEHQQRSKGETGRRDPTRGRGFCNGRKSEASEKSQGFQKLLSRRFCSISEMRWHTYYLNPKFPEGGQTLMYEVHAEGKRVQRWEVSTAGGSEYPQGADLLILPFQGSEFLKPVALRS